MFATLFCALMIQNATAQSKVFREVAGEISSDFEPIVQDNSLIGYLMFTKLEAVSKDSFNYKISIMDENLNDIGVVNFRQSQLLLKSVTFEQDVIMLLYRKEDTKTKTETYGRRGQQRDVKETQDSAFVQFINLEGKILKTESSKITVSRNWVYTKYSSYLNIEAPYMQIANLPQKGFAFLCIEKDKQTIVAYNPKGERVWTKAPPKGADDYYMIANVKSIYLLTYKQPMSKRGTKGTYEVHSINANDGKSSDNYELKDKEGSYFRVLDFQIDKATNNPVLSGMIHVGSERFMNAKREFKSYYKGVFTVSFNGTSKGDTKPVFSYWSNGSNSEISQKGKLIKENKFISIQEAVSDYEGNKYFVGSLVKRKARPFAIVGGILLLPVPLADLAVPFLTYTKLVSNEVTILKLNSKGVLQNIANIDAKKVKYDPYEASLNGGGKRLFFSVYNAVSKSSYLVISDADNTYLYNLKDQKVAKTIPRSNGESVVTVIPAKEGSIMISEINRKEKYSKLSIEPVQ